MNVILKDKDKGVEGRIVFVLYPMTEEKFNDIKNSDYSLYKIPNDIDDKYSWQRSIFLAGELANATNDLLKPIYGFNDSRWMPTGEYRNKVTYEIAKEPKGKDWIRLMTEKFNPNVIEFKNQIKDLDSNLKYGVILRCYGQKKKVPTNN